MSCSMLLFYLYKSILLSAFFLLVFETEKPFLEKPFNVVPV